MGQATQGPGSPGRAVGTLVPVTSDQQAVQSAEDAVPDAAIAPVGSSEDSAGESGLTVWLALAANVGVGLLKLAAGLVSGSASLLSEAAHSAGDSTTEIFLLIAQKRSQVLHKAPKASELRVGTIQYIWNAVQRDEHSCIVRPGVQVHEGKVILAASSNRCGDG